MDTIEALLRAGVEWPVIEAATGIDQDALRALRQRLEGIDQSQVGPQAVRGGCRAVSRSS